MTEFDVCVIGSGAGGGPVAFDLSLAGYSVVVLEKGPWYTEKDFFKDEIGVRRRHGYVPDKRKEPHVVEELERGEWVARSTAESGWDLWNGSLVGGATNLMSGFFLRKKPMDFRLRSEFGPVEGADVVDWPITYDELEPYYETVEREVGVSGRVVPHPLLEPRSTPDFPYPPLVEHPISRWIDETGRKIGAHPIPLPRAILSRPANGRRSCSYTTLCGTYGCPTGAKGNARSALLDRAVASGNCEIRPHSSARRILSDAKGRAVAAEYFDRDGELRTVTAKIFVVACQPIETSRLLLLSSGPKFPNGLGNNHGQVGKFLIFSAASSAEGAFPYSAFTKEQGAELGQGLPFINRALQDWYVINDRKFGPRCKGGSMELAFVNPNPIGLARYFAFGAGGKMMWGKEFKESLRRYISEARHVMVEIFGDWHPTPGCGITLDPLVKDKFGTPVARVRLESHPRNERIGGYLAAKAGEFLTAMGGKDIEIFGDGSPSTNLPAGGCRFGRDPASSVLDPDCRSHEVENLFVTDGSFMPTGGSVPYTWTIYANSFRVAARIKAQLA